MRSFLILVSGARAGDLDRLPAELAAYEELGAAILIAAATTGALLADGLHAIMNVSLAPAALIAVLTALVLAYGDRWIAILTAPLAGRTLLIAAFPRILFGILLAGLLSLFPVLQVFSQEINAQVAVIQQQTAAAANKAIANSPLQAEIRNTQLQIQDYKEVIASGGGPQQNPSQDGELRSLKKELNQAIKVEAKNYEQWQCQLIGGPGCGGVAGAGPLANLDRARYLDSEQQVANLQEQVRAREQTLIASSAPATRARLDEARRNLPGAEALLRSDQALLAAEQHAASLIRTRPAGLLTRLTALDQLSVRDSALSAARLVVALLFISVECLPVFVILLMRRGSRERFLKAARADELRLAGVAPGVLEQIPDDTPVSPADSYDLALRGMREVR